MSLRRQNLAIMVVPWILALLALPACGHPAQRRLAGRWVGDSIENVEPGLLAAATGWVRGTSFDFDGEELTVVIPAEEPRTGLYEVVSFRDSQVALAVKGSDGRSYSMDLKLDDERSFRWLLADGRAVVMRRAE